MTATRPAPASSELLGRYDGAYEDKIQKLQNFKEQVDFAARHRDFVSNFELRVFIRLKKLGKYQQALDAGAGKLPKLSDALELLSSMSQAERFDDEALRAEFLTPENKFLREAWQEAVVLEGLQLEEYAALSQFRG
ncbi:hypothetical protein HXX76_001780 [Chlamydomonas incerta]|uniref:Uncharacterized protein n=1 Tax=Chlamydomonas incerta TaxID=51695 RepID=A0A835TDF3_CHLIN|nr:hypothetical protein HXX76_001780 [Chlamydomonas incerta]|eukprot:KAG2443422.1 hypothetical protein HXX76_001780 [Chlamydomonas incerta]